MEEKKLPLPICKYKFSAQVQLSVLVYQVQLGELVYQVHKHKQGAASTQVQARSGALGTQVSAHLVLVLLGDLTQLALGDTNIFGYYKTNPDAGFKEISPGTRCPPRGRGPARSGRSAAAGTSRTAPRPERG